MLGQAVGVQQQQRARTDDRLRGAEIDLLLQMPQRPANATLLAAQPGARIERAIGLRKIDILVADPHTPDSPLLGAARRQAMDLGEEGPR